MENIIKSFLAKEESGIREIFEQTYPFVYCRAKCLQKKEEDAYKLMREVYLYLQKQSEKLTVSNIYQLLAEATYSLGCQKYRKKKAREAAYIEFEKQNYYASKNQDVDQTNEIIIDALDELPDMYQATLYAFYMDGMKISDLSRVFQYNEGTIMNRLNYAHKYIQKLMEHYQEEKKVKVQFSAEGIQRAMNVWTQENVMSATAAQAVYISICRELSVSVDGNVIEENKESFKSDITMEILVEELERHMKKEGMNKKKIAGIVGIAVIVCIVAGISLWSMSQKDAKKSSEEKNETLQTEENVSDDNTLPENTQVETTPNETTPEEEDSNETSNETEGQEETTTDNDTTEYLLPNSDTVKLTESDLEGMSKEQLKLARNEIYARHGLIFGVEELDQYFGQKSWYEPKYTMDQFYDEVEMSLIEEYNVTFISERE